MKYWQSQCIFLFMLTSLLSGCITPSNDLTFEEISNVIQERNAPPPVWLRTPAEMIEQNELVQSILAEPLCADDAVRIAFINNSRIQVLLAELGIAQANLVQARTLPNPSLSFLRLTPVSGEYNIERRVLFDVMQLLTMPLRTSIERKHVEQIKLQIAMEILHLAAQTRKVYYSAIASEQKVKYLEDIVDLSKASAQLARKMAEVGNFNRLELAREQTFYAEIMAKLAQAKLTAMRDREMLIRLMGLWGEQICFTLPDRLPELPAIVQEACELEQEALLHRLDIQAMRYNIERKAKALGLTKATRFINVFDLGYARNNGLNVQHQTGYEIMLEVPLFDWGNAKIAKAESIYMLSIWQLRELAVNARSEVREFYQAYRITYDIAKHYCDEIIPLRKNILEENLLRYNGMLIGPFELLHDKNQQILSVNTYIEKLRDFWIAEIDLQTALMAKSPREMQEIR